MALSFQDGGGEDQPMAEINVTPLVDVMLVLLVIFIVMAPLFSQALSVNLPRVKAPAADSRDVTRLTMTMSGMTLDGQAVTPDALVRELKHRVGLNPDLVVRLEAPGQVSYEQVARVMGWVREAGVGRLAFATQNP
ncbi:MAG: biopolymer transporter ExbD [Deltaproteobacteria bacterium]|nr:biopolymer transporter ExbD [Deltaproteobacteria bacterium]